MNFVYWGYEYLPDTYDFYLKTFVCNSTEDLCDFNVAFKELADTHKSVSERVVESLDLGDKNFLLENNIFGYVLSGISKRRLTEEIEDIDLKRSLENLDGDIYKTISVALKNIYLENLEKC